MGPTRIAVTFDPSPRKARGKAREVFREAMRDQATSWHRNYAPRHFARGARSRYGYRRRSPNYERRKSRLIAAGRVQGPRRDLIYTGLTMRKMRGAAQIKAFPTRARITMFTPSYVRIRPRGNRPNLHDELTRVATEEKQSLGEMLGLAVDRGLRRIKAPKTVTTG